MNSSGFVHVAAVILCAAFTSSGAATPPVDVEISRFSFKPQEITVAVGTEVRWTNRDQTVHSIVSAEGGFSSPGLDTAERFSRSFEHAGDFTYVCSLHPYMKGIVHVREGPAKGS